MAVSKDAHGSSNHTKSLQDWISVAVSQQSPPSDSSPPNGEPLTPDESANDPLDDHFVDAETAIKQGLEQCFALLLPKEPDTKESEDQPASSLSSFFNSWVDMGCAYQKNLLGDTVEMLTQPSQKYGSVVEHFSQSSQQLLKGCSDYPGAVIEHQMDLMTKQLELGQRMMQRLLGETPEPVVTPHKTDQRFTDDAWQDHVLFDFIKQSYLLNAQSLMSITQTLAIEEEKKAPLDYCLRQICSAMSPSNFALTNPEVLEKIRETKGESLYQGLRLFIEDQANSPQFLNVCMSGGGDFVLGENLASTPGKVIFENALMQLIQYEPSTAKVHAKPLLIVPSWVNKFYILDLQEKNSLVKWAVDHGFTVFMISWVNPDQQYRDVGFEDYMRSGILQAIDQIKSMCNVESVNTAGYCLGGILLASTLAYLKARGEETIASATYLASSVDFEDPGEMGMFLNDEMVSVFEKTIDDAGYLDGRLLSIGFNLLRENDLYWNYFIQNYLKGERPPTFDILYWNSDNTNVPAKTHRFVLRDLHVNNGLIKSDAISLLGVPLDLSKVDTPLYVLATDKDHIAKWQSTYSAVSVQGGERRFVLAGSGHIAGVVNPPAANKYYHYTNDELSENPEHWLEGADKQSGSWWGDWRDWLLGHSGELIGARVISRDCIIEDAPGRYVKRRL